MGNPPVDRREVMDKIKGEFGKRDLLYVAKRDTLFARADLLDGLINARFQPISEQIYTEARWLILYTDDWPRASAVLDRLEASLAEVPQRLEQQADGSWGPGYTEWYRKLEPTIDALQQKAVVGGPLAPLAFMQPLQDPKTVIDYLETLRSSDIARTGRNNRDEFGSVQSALSQLLFKPKIAKLLKDRSADLKFSISDELRQRYIGYLRDVQSKVTGFWGPTYAFSGGSLDVQDMSYTFHNVHYFDDYGDPALEGRAVPMLGAIARTTLDIKDFVFPNGWIANKPDSATKPKYADHHNYDVVTLLANCWREGVMDHATKIRVEAEMQDLLDWCLTSSLEGDGFVVSGDATPADAWYFAVRFLLGVGFWDGSPPWGQMAGTVANKPDPKDLAGRLLKTFATLTDHSPMADNVVEVLTAAATGQALPSLRPDS